MATTKAAAIALVPTPDEGDAYLVTRNGMRFAGTHLLVELFGVPGTPTPLAVEGALREAVDACGATLLHLHVAPLADGGVTGIAVLSESHISLHCWPERGYVAVDVFLCGTLDPYAAVAPLRRALAPARVLLSEYRRGILA